MYKNDDYVTNKVWNIYFDDNYDIVYIFLANFELIKGELDEIKNKC